MTVQGHPVSVDAQGGFSALVGARQEGRLAILAQATNAAGQQASAVVYVNF